MEFKDVKLIATDMDGTLLNSQKQLDPAFYPVLAQLKAKGILFCAASGRQYYNIKNQFPGVSDDIIFVAENGSYVVYQNRELLVQALDADTVHNIIKTARTIPNAYTILCGRKQAYVDNTEPAFMKNVEMYYDRRQIVSDLLEVTDDDFLKIAICDLDGSEANSYPYFQPLEKALQVKVSGAIWLDLSHQLANKGRAIKTLQQAYNINHHQTMVFGDYLNDLEMMQEGYFSYAMENAHPDIISAARFTTASNDNNGVLNILQQLLSEIS